MDFSVLVPVVVGWTYQEPDRFGKRDSATLLPMPPGRRFTAKHIFPLFNQGILVNYGIS